MAVELFFASLERLRKRRKFWEKIDGKNELFNDNENDVLLEENYSRLLVCSPTVQRNGATRYIPPLLSKSEAKLFTKHKIELKQMELEATNCARDLYIIENLRKNARTEEARVR
jgi:hypothetical protein